MPTRSPIPANETARLARLRELFVLDSAPEPLFDNIARMASEVCQVPIALISLIDTERQWFKANVGLPGVNETPREVAFCAHAILDDGVLEIPDATRDERFVDNPLVQGHPDIRFYAGAPLTMPEGERVGTLCVIDRHAGQLSAAQIKTLEDLASIAVQALTMRRDLITRSLLVRSEYEQALSVSESRHRALVESQNEFVVLAKPDGELIYVNPAYARHVGQKATDLIGRNQFDLVDPDGGAGFRALAARTLDGAGTLSSENRMLAADGSSTWVAWTNSLQRDDGGRAVLHSVGRDVTERKRVEQALSASEAFLLRTGRVAGVGGWECDLVTGTIRWSEETRRIHDVGADYVPTLESAIAFYPPEYRAQIESAIRTGIERGDAWDLELPLLTAAGRSVWVRVVGEVEFLQGKAVRLIGAIQDVTEQKALEQKVAENEAFVRKVTDNLPLRIAYVDRALRYRFVNLAHCRRFRRTREEIIGHTRDELLGERRPTEIGDRVAAVLEGRPQRFEYEEMVDGVSRCIDRQFVPDTGPDGIVRGFFTTALDVTERSHSERALRALTLESQRQANILRLVTEAIPTTVVIIGLDGRYRFANGAFERYCGRTREQIVGHTASELLGADEVARHHPFMARAFAGETVHFELDYAVADGTRWRALSCIPLRPGGGEVDGLVGISQDITQQRREQDRLMQLSQRDPLTALLNRAGLENCLDLQLQGGTGATVALLYIDLDRFKPVNDRFGHPVGDRLLQMVAHRLSALVRPTDAVARIGGDEFAIALVGARSLTNAEAVADKVVAAIAKPFDVDGRELEIGTSVGVAFGIPPSGDWRDLIARADAMLYRAKEAGRGRYVSANQADPANAMNGSAQR